MRMIYVISGFVCVLVGAGISIAGYGGVIDFQLNMGSTFEARLGNATPGVVILALGVIYSFIAALGFKVETSFREDGAAFTAYAGRGEASPPPAN